MYFEWHGLKNEKNVEKHGIDFRDDAQLRILIVQKTGLVTKTEKKGEQQLDRFQAM